MQLQNQDAPDPRSEMGSKRSEKGTSLLVYRRLNRHERASAAAVAGGEDDTEGARW